jgi:hypothetical protein
LELLLQNQNLTEIPTLTVDDIIDIVRGDNNSPRNSIIIFLREKIINHIHMSLDNIRKIEEEYPLEVINGN